MATPIHRVGQMGIHPPITALNAGARYVFAGRACDAALFASDMIRRGMDAGLAYDVGHVLECGALACDPGSPSDCLIVEIHDDDSALFVAPNVGRRCTPHSIAAARCDRASYDPALRRTVAPGIGGLTQPTSRKCRHDDNQPA